MNRKRLPVGELSMSVKPDPHFATSCVAEERARVTLASIGDAVLSTDLAGNITYMNPVAERMTGWSAWEATGRPLQEVMRIIDADSREAVRDPLALAAQYQCRRRRELPAGRPGWAGIRDRRHCRPDS
jgi:PAS domain-containing protein